MFMLCCAQMCVSAGQCVMKCVRQCMGGSVAVHAGFVDGVMNPFAAYDQPKVMPATKPHDVQSVLTC